MTCIDSGLVLVSPDEAFRQRGVRSSATVGVTHILSEINIKGAHGDAPRLGV